MLSKRCFALAAEAKWLLYQEMMTYREPGHAGAAFEVLALVETDLARLDRLKEAAADWLPECCRTGLCDAGFDPGELS
ncbi:hypothetical protein AB0C52_29425 [Streptomyces sp. NPDC048717]|uniref:hypothetical protein n=1 Tax=Streptomyces sp. NPDC048717 TaxID=3154928 RepID=UPI003420BB68